MRPVFFLRVLNYLYIDEVMIGLKEQSKYWPAGGWRRKDAPRLCLGGLKVFVLRLGYGWFVGAFVEVTFGV